ncbi:MAG TPA: beta-galactosidase trimerization domain-containing protein [Terriglobia bacterium]|nr:beta-galactosidase trimerization domain-containing protein [Terriglobia bacterium]
MHSAYHHRLTHATEFWLGLFVGLVILPPTHVLAGTGPQESAARVDAPFTISIETPHVPWGKPSPGSPIHAFVVPSVSEGRTLIELAERMNLAFDTVMIDDAWDVNTWTVGTDDNYEARNYKLLYRYLTENLTSSKRHDVIVMPSLHGWNRLPAAAREAICKRVREGAGLVLIHPTTGLPAPDDPKVKGPLNNFIDTYDVPASTPESDLWTLSPLVGVLSDRLDARGFREVRPDAVAGGIWKTVADHYVTRNVPFEAFPTEYVKHYKYQLGANSTVLVTGEGGEPIIAVKNYGRGRVVALGYLNEGLSPQVDWKILGQHDDHWWEYFYSLLCRSIIWAAHREPSLTLDRVTVESPAARPGLDQRKLLAKVLNPAGIPRAEIRMTVVNEWGEPVSHAATSVSLAPGTNPLSLTVPRDSYEGHHSVDVILTSGGKHCDWGAASYDVVKTGEILSISTDRAFYARGDTARVQVSTRTSSRAQLSVELLDNRRRLIGTSLSLAQAEQAVPVAVGPYTTNIGWMRASLESPEGRVLDRKQVRVNFASQDRDFGAYEVILPWYGPPSYQPWTPTLDDQFRKAGVTVVESPERNFRLIQELHAPGFGVYWHYRESYLQQKDKFLQTGDKKYLIREPDLASDSWLEELRKTIRDHMKATEQFRPLASYLADESSLTAYGDPLDFSWSEPTLTKFRDWLKRQYPSLEALNQEWGSGFQSWEGVVPLTTSEAQAKGNYSGWMDHRTFMEQVFAHALQVAADAVKREDPGSLPSISGTQAPGPSNAVNWYLLDSIVDYLQPYSEDDQDELHRTMHPGLILTGFTGYGSHGAELRYELWHRLLHGQTGASVFWQYTMLNADLSLTGQGRDLQSVTHELRDEGLALLLRGAERQNCGVAVHYSLPSVRAQWITDGHIAPHEVSDGDKTSAHLKRFHENRHAWLEALEDSGYQYDFLTTEQIEAGKLSNYHVLILPDSIALSDGEVAAIHRFAARGGFIIADAETGLMDGHARWQEKGRLDDLLGVERANVRSAKAAIPAVSIQADTQAGAGIQVAPADPDLRPASSLSSVSANATALLIENHAAASHSLTLNFWMSGYDKVRGAAVGEPWRNLLRRYLGAAGVRPVADVVTAAGRHLTCSELVAYRTGGGEIIAILPEPKCRDAGAVTLRLAAPKFVYDLREHRFLGHVDRAGGTLVTGEPLVYAAEDAAAAPPTILAAGNRTHAVRAGDQVKLEVRLRVRPGEQASSSAAHIEVRNPKGGLVDYYGTNLPLTITPLEFSVPLALNDLPGRWTVSIREPFAHQGAATHFVVVPDRRLRRASENY